MSTHCGGDGSGGSVPTIKTIVSIDVWISFKFLENIYFSVTSNWLNFSGGHTTDDNFKATLYSKITFHNKVEK